MSFSEQIPEKNAGHLSSERSKKIMWDEEEERYEVAELFFFHLMMSQEQIKSVAHNGYRERQR